MSRALSCIGPAEVRARMSPRAAVEALRAALRSGFRPEDDHARIADPLRGGEFLLMPSETDSAVGIKVLTVTPDNPARGLERIQGLYLLLDADTHAPTAIIDGPALTDLRTPAVSIAAIADLLTESDDALDVVLYGAGHQGIGHLRTLEDVVRGRREIGDVTAIVRSPERVGDVDGINRCLAVDSAEAREATASAGLIMCTTTAREPLFDGDLVAADAIVVAVGSHEPDARELPADLMGRSSVIVEDISVALRECGDVVMAISDGFLNAADLIPMADVVSTPEVLDRGRGPIVFKSSGMPWEDLVIAAAIMADPEDVHSVESRHPALSGR